MALVLDGDMIPDDAIFNYDTLADVTALPYDRVSYMSVFPYLGLTTNHTVVTDLTLEVALHVIAVVAIKRLDLLDTDSKHW